MRNNYKTWIEISKNNLFWNLKQIKRVVGRKVKVLAVVKANAYGHGLEEIVTLLRDRVDFFGVDNIDEALRIRKLKIKTPVLVLGYVPTERIIDAVNNNISIALYNSYAISKIKNMKFEGKLKVHLKIETGMHRQGIDLIDLRKCIDNLSSKNIFIEGVYSHFSASGGIFTNEIYHLDMVRAGLCIYGYFNSSEIKKRAENIYLKPVMKWKSVIAQIKLLHKNDYVGYSRTWKARGNTKIAVIPVGYYDGFDRRFSNKGNVIGRVAMNMHMREINDKNFKIGDEIVILGDADKMASDIDTINHEILARINYLIPKRVV